MLKQSKKIWDICKIKYNTIIFKTEEKIKFLNNATKANNEVVQKSFLDIDILKQWLNIQHDQQMAKWMNSK